MNRRDFVAGLAALPFVTSDVCAPRSVKQAYLINGSIPTEIRIGAFLTERGAEKERRSYMSHPWGVTWSEHYASNPTTLDLPQHLEELPGNLQRWDTVVGAAAVEGELLVGATRRDKVTCIIRMKVAEEDIMLTLANHFAEKRMPDPIAIVLSNRSLERLLPTEKETGLNLVPSDAWWP